MLSLFRRGFFKKLLLVILAIGAVSIVVTGFGTGGMGGVGPMGNARTLASIEGEAITSADVSTQVERQLTRAREQQPELDIGTFLSGGILEEILDQLLQSKALALFGLDQGLAASKEMIDREIARLPAFHNVAGQFDQLTFQQALQAQNVTERQLRDELQAAIVQRQLLMPVSGGVHVPEGVALQYAGLLLEQRTGTVVTIPSERMGRGSEPTDAEVQAFYRQRQAQYTVPERRVIRFAVFGASQVAAAAKPTDAEIAAFYSANQATYGPKETRTLSQVVLPDEAAARRFAAQVAAGTSFTAAAQGAGYASADISLGVQSREAYSRLASPEAAAAAFGVNEGQTAGPVRSPLGWHVVRVDAINRTPARALASVRNEIAAQLERQKIQQASGDLAARIEDSIADGSSFDEIVAANRLTSAETVPVTAAGATPDNPGWQRPQELGALLKTAFDMAEGEDPVVETITPNLSFALMQVDRVLPAAPAPLARIRERVKSDLILKRQSDQARALAQSIVNKINAGTPVRQAVAQAGGALPPPDSVRARRIDIARRSEQVPPPLAMLFSLPRGKARLLSAPGGAGWYVVHLEQIVPGKVEQAPGLVEATRSQFAQVSAREYAQQFTRAVQGQLDIERDEKALEQLKAELQRAGGQ